MNQSNCKSENVRAGARWPAGCRAPAVPFLFGNYRAESIPSALPPFTPSLRPIRISDFHSLHSPEQANTVALLLSSSGEIATNAFVRHT